MLRVCQVNCSPSYHLECKQVCSVVQRVKRVVVLCCCRGSRSKLGDECNWKLSMNLLKRKKYDDDVRCSPQMACHAAADFLFVIRRTRWIQFLSWRPLVDPVSGSPNTQQSVRNILPVLLSIDLAKFHRTHDFHGFLYVVVLWFIQRILKI